MKKLLLGIMLFTTGLVYAQLDEQEEVVSTKPAILISVYGTSQKAYLTENNPANSITLKKSVDGKMIISNPQARADTAFIRKFMIVNEKEEELKIAFTSRTVGILNINLKDILSQADVGKTYFLYTIATPKNPEIAARIRVRRILLSKIVVKE